MQTESPAKPQGSGQTSAPDMLDDLILLIEQGQPVPQHLRPAVCFALKRSSKLDQALAVHHYRSCYGAPFTKSATQPKSAYRLAGIATNRSPSACLEAYGMFRDLLPEIQD